jgi:hypothetical protein
MNPRTSDTTLHYPPTLQTTFDDSVEEFCNKITKDNRTIQPTVDVSSSGLVLPPLASNASVSSPSFPLRVTPLLHSFDDLDDSTPVSLQHIYRRPVDTLDDQSPYKRTRYEDQENDFYQRNMHNLNPNIYGSFAIPNNEIGSLTALLSEPPTSNPMQTYGLLQPMYDINSMSPPVIEHQVVSPQQTPSPRSIAAEPRRGSRAKKADTMTPRVQSPILDDGKKKHFLNQDAVAILKDWFYQNLDHPYPTSDQKEQLSKRTGLTYLQVSNWFTNSRK